MSITVANASNTTIVSSKTATTTTQTGSFTTILDGLTTSALGRPSSLAALADYLKSDEGAAVVQDLNVQAENAVSHINSLLDQLLKANNIQLSGKVTIEIDQTGHVSVSDGADKAKITQLLNENPEVAQAIRHAASLLKRAALIDMYDAYLQAFYKAYAKGGIKAANEVSEKYFALTTNFTYSFDPKTGFQMDINAQKVEEYLKNLPDQLYHDPDEDEQAPRKAHS